MKKYFFLSFFFLLLSTNHYSQIIQDYGLKIGYVNSSQVFTNEDAITRRINGYSISAFVELFNFKGFSISPELKYIRKGVGLEAIYIGSDVPQPNLKFNVHHNYLSIPISIVYKMQLGLGTPFIKIAPRYDILLESYNDLSSPRNPTSIYDEYKNVFGGTFSIGFIPELFIVVNPFIEVSYHMDFTDTYSTRNTKIKNNALEINLGLLF